MVFVKYQRSVPFSVMGGRKAPKSKNSTLNELSEFFSKIVTTAGENAPVLLMKIAKRLKMSNKNRPAVKVSHVVSELGNSKKVALVVAKVLDDERVLELPAFDLVCLSCSKSVREKIIKNGGKVQTLDQFIKVAGTLDNIMLIQGDSNQRKASKYFGPAPGERNSATFPRANHKIKNNERRVNYKKPVSFESEESN